MEKFPGQGNIFFVENFHKSIFVENLPYQGKIFFVENLPDQEKIFFLENFPKSFFVEKFPDQGKIFFVENFPKFFLWKNSLIKKNFIDCRKLTFLTS